MLILTRRNGESLKIGDNVTVTVLSVRGNQVRLGIHAPRSVQVYREELLTLEDPNQGGELRIVLEA